MSPLSCTVRACEEELAGTGTSLACSNGHTFDRARAGYVNLLQPQDKRSKEPGDDAATVAARERLWSAGIDTELVAASLEWLATCAPRAGARVADIGAGIGSWLGAWARNRLLEAYGVDLSARCARVAARNHPEVTWLVANADRRLPFTAGSLDVLLGVKGPKNPTEFARVLAPKGHLLLVVSAADDLVELRTATANGGIPRAPAELALERFEPAFTLETSFEVRTRRNYGQAGLADLMRVAYRGARRAEAERLSTLEHLEVTTSATFLHLRVKG